MEQSKFYQIKNITEQEYTLVGCDGSVITRPIRDIDKSASAFTIQDAKDGDILCTYECDEPKIVFILKGTPKKHYALSYHCYYNIMYPHFGPDSEKGCLAPKDEDIKPATKEQRDLLFSKMKEADYEWDANKKELKKIESYSLRSIIKDKPSPAIKKVVDSLTTWSEEDEELCEHLIKSIEESDPLPTSIYSDCKRWLKTLKGRVQPKQEWKQENTGNLTDFENAMMHIGNSFFGQYAELDPNDTNSIKEQANFLLELVPKQEWSEEDERMYRGLHNLIYSTPYCDSRKELSDWLKSLKDRYTWKPSDGQMKFLKKCIEAYNEVTFPTEVRVLTSLYNDLKKL